MTSNCNKFNWSTPDATIGKINELEKEVVRMEDEINQQGLAFKREEGTDAFIITKDTIHSVNSTELNLYPIPDLSHVPPTGEIFAYTLPRSYVNTNNQVIGTVYTTLNENNTFNNPAITKVNAQYIVSYITSDKPGIEISDFNPFDMYTLGELRIEWMPKPTTLTSPAKVVCDIIDAKNALQLYETPIPVFFRPVNYGVDDNYWWMTWGYKNDSAEFSKLLEGQPFRFTESSFGHNYTLYKNGGGWSGNNMCTAFPSKTSYHSWTKGSVFSLFVSNSEGMKTQLRALGIDPGSNTAYALRTYAKLYKSNGTLANISTDWYTNSSQTISGYDKAMCVVDDKSVSNGETITCKIDINGNVSLLTSQAHTSQSGLVWFTPLVNCLDSISYYNVSSITPQKELKLYMKKGEVFKFTDNNWDGSTNPFVYLNNVDGYNITPDPSSAATLTTPYSIVSNGVMLAENLESHTYKINDIGNDITAINNQISNINNQIFTLQHFQAYIEEKNSWYNILEENMVSILGSCMLKFALPIDLNGVSTLSVRDVQNSAAAAARSLVPWQMSYQGIDSLPQLTFSANTTQPIKAITYSTDTTANDDESLPTTKWVNDKISAASFNTDSPTFTGTTTVADLNATNITANTFNGFHLGTDNKFYKLPAIPVIRDDLVMEVGRFIDFHYNASTDTDNTARFSISSQGTLYFDHSFIISADIKARNCISDNGNLHDAINKIAALESSTASYIVGMTLKLKTGVNPPSTGTWNRVGLWGVYETILTKSNGAKFHIYTTYNGAYATVNIRLSDQSSTESIPLTELGVASTDSYWLINSGAISSGTYPVATVQIPLNTIGDVEFRFNGGNIEPAHTFNIDTIFSFSVKLSDFSNSSYKHQYVEWERTA